MSKVHVRPQGANVTDPSPVQLDLGDLAAFQTWLTFVREHVIDTLAVAEDATKPLRERMFSRHEAIRRLAEEERSLFALLDVGARALPPAPQAPPRS